MRGTMGDRVVVDLERMPGATFFPDATLNFADNLLANRGSGVAVIFKGEDRPIRTMTSRRAPSGGRGVRRRPSPARHPAWRSRGRISAQCARGDRRRARRGSRGCRVVVVLTRFRRPGGHRSIRTDRAEDPGCRRRVLVCREAPRLFSADRRGRARAALAEADCSSSPTWRLALRSRFRMSSPGTSSFPQVLARIRRSSRCRSTIRFTSFTRRALPVFRSASSMAPAGRSSSTSRNISFTATLARPTASSTLRPAAG